jgi:type II secretory pathway pseudopilin PulG
MFSLTGRSASRSSFTLVELLVAIAVLALLLTALAQILAFVSGSWLVGRQNSDNMTKGRATLDLIARDLANGVFRPDLPAFVDQNGNPSSASVNYSFPDYAFYTGRLTSGTRALSMVDYYQSTNSTSSVLERGALPLEYTNAAPFETTALPFGATSLSGLSQLVAASSDYQQVATGVVAFRFFFFHALGNYYSLNYIDNATNRANAVGCTIAVLDASSQQMLAQQGKLSSLINSGAFAVPSNPTYGFKYTWEQNLNAPGFFNGYPKKVATGLKVFERVTFLPAVSP